MEHIRAEAVDVLIVATVTGLRRGELFALRWRDIDWDKGIIHVRASNYAARIEERTKTKAGKAGRSAVRGRRATRSLRAKSRRDTDARTT